MVKKNDDLFLELDTLIFYKRGTELIFYNYINAQYITPPNFIIFLYKISTRDLESLKNNISSVIKIEKLVFESIKSDFEKFEQYDPQSMIETYLFCKSIRCLKDRVTSFLDELLPSTVIGRDLLLPILYFNKQNYSKNDVTFFGKIIADNEQFYVLKVLENNSIKIHKHENKNLNWIEYAFTEYVEIIQ